MEHIQKHEDAIGFVKGGENHQWRKWIIGGTFATCISGLLLAIFIMSDLDYSSGREESCYWNGDEPVNVEDENGISTSGGNVTERLNRIVKYGEALCCFYMIVGISICVRPLFMYAQILMHIANLLFIIFLCTLTTMMSDTAIL